jgi:transcriptional regulator with PAS, ATPase and Fis domain/Tfp pilus assembly protein PilF
MNNLSLLNIKNNSYSSSVSVLAYMAAYELFNNEEYGACIEQLQDISISNVSRDKQNYTVRDVVLLIAWCLYRQSKRDECLQWLKVAEDSALVPIHDEEVALLRSWIECIKGYYAKVFNSTNRFIEHHSGELHPLLAEYLFLRGYCSNCLGYIEKAIDDCELAAAIFRIVSKDKEVAEVSNLIGVMMLQRAKYDLALIWFKRSLDINEALNMPGIMAKNYLNMAIAYYKYGNYDSAYEAISKAMRISQHHNHRITICRAQVALGNVYRLRRDYQKARKYLKSAHSLATEEQIPREECLSLEFLGDVFRDEGKADDASRYYKQAMAIAQRIAPQGDLVMELLRREGECLVARGLPAEAMVILAKARTLSHMLKDRFEEGAILRIMALASAGIAEWNAARKYSQESIEILEIIDARHELAASHLSAARIMAALADEAERPETPEKLLESAWQHCVAAEHLFSRLQIPFWLEKTRRMLNQIGMRRRVHNKIEMEDRWLHDGRKNDVRIVAHSSSMKSVLGMCDAFARFGEPVLITGETGTGKELIARRIHQNSDRSRRTLVAVNVSAIPKTMFEREFFGHHRGAFSGADRDSPGYAGMAHEGTLFLDEIAELPIEMQPKLLRLLQDGEYASLGNPKSKRADIRLIAATNQDLVQLIAQGKFRQDLFYRLRVLEIQIPALRERPEDVVPLLEHFLGQMSHRSVAVAQFFNSQSIQALLRFPWPGNVREVAVAARRAYIGMVTEGRVRFQLGLEPNSILVTGPEESLTGKIGQTIDEDILRSRILVALEEAKGNKSEAARKLKVARPTLYRWLKRLGIPK